MCSDDASTGAKTGRSEGEGRIARLEIRLTGETIVAEVAVPQLLGNALACAGFPLEMPCGGQGRCGKCRVRAAGALSPLETASAASLGEDSGIPAIVASPSVEEANSGETPSPVPWIAHTLGETAAYPDPPVTHTLGETEPPDSSDAPGELRLACRTVMEGDCTVFLHAEESTGHLSGHPARLCSAIAERNKNSPDLLPLPEGLLAECATTALSLSWKATEQEEDVRAALARTLANAGFSLSDAERRSALRNALRAWAPGKDLAASVHRRRGRIWLTSGGEELCGAACDLGTTTVACRLFRLRDGALLATRFGRNLQSHFGGDVIARIAAATAHDPDDPGKDTPLSRLQRLAAETLETLLLQAARDAGISPSAVSEIVCCGNSAMHALLYGYRPVFLSRLPFLPAERISPELPGADLGLHAFGRASVRFLPLVGGFVGGDTTGLLLATRTLLPPKRRRLLLDLGTNGEIVLQWEERLLACSTAAGPAFEGGNISCGMPATEGAVIGVERTDEGWCCTVAGGGAPAGLCGSGLLDALAVLRGWNLVAPDGRLVSPGEASPQFRPLLSGDTGGNNRGIELAKGVRLTQKDIREFQLAKGAVRAGAELLLEKVGGAWSDLEECIAAGAFGSSLKPESLVATGLLPPETAERITPLGGGAGEGCRLVLLGGDPLWNEACRLAAATDHVDLGGHPRFQETFVRFLALA